MITLRTGLLLLILFISEYSFAQTWGSPVKVLNTNTGTGGYMRKSSDVCIVNGRPAIVAFDQSRGDLVYVRANDAAGLTWGTPVTIKSQGYVGDYPSLEIVDGLPAIAYFNENRVEFMRANDVNGTSWGTPLVLETSAFAEYISLKIINGNPAVAYRDHNRATIRYVRANNTTGTSWEAPVSLTLSGNYVGNFLSLEVVNGNPAIACFDFQYGNPEYIRANDVNGASWGASIRLDVSEDWVGEFTSMKVINGVPVIVYHDVTNGHLRMIKAADENGATWNAPDVFDLGHPGGVGGACSMSLINGIPAIAYQDNYEGKIKFVAATDATGTSWNAGVYTTSSYSYASHIVLTEVDGKPAFSFGDYFTEGTTYVISSDVSGAIWNESPTSFNVFDEIGTYTSCQIVDGRPAMVYYKGDENYLYYVRALDANGLQWGTPVLVDNTRGGEYACLRIVNGKPAVAYFNSWEGSLKYSIANDAQGTSWSAAITIANQDGSGKYASMQIADGNPAIAYLEDNSQTLRYVRATNTDGTAWGTPVKVDGPVNSEGPYVRGHISLEIINGRPAIAYAEDNNGRVKFVLASNTTGSSWGSPVTISSGGNDCIYITLKEVNGNPAISFMNEYDGTMKYVRATNNTGSSWSAPVQPDNSGHYVGLYGTMAIIDGKPAIAYYDDDILGLKYVIASNVNGTAWEAPVVLDPSIGSGQFISLISFAGTGAAVSYYSSVEKQPYFLAAGDAALPVNMTDVKAYQKGDNNVVEWTSLEEYN
ncbi:MAG TPA: hypothetical protein VIK74_10785, partial [Parasegetibacter sp.]